MALVFERARSVGLRSSSRSRFFKLSALALALSENRERAPVSLKLSARSAQVCLAVQQLIMPGT
jgi:hypothetical protein